MCETENAAAPTNKRESFTTAPADICHAHANLKHRTSSNTDGSVDPGLHPFLHNVVAISSNCWSLKVAGSAPHIIPTQPPIGFRSWVLRQALPQNLGFIKSGATKPPSNKKQRCAHLKHSCFSVVVTKLHPERRIECTFPRPIKKGSELLLGLQAHGLMAEARLGQKKSSGGHKTYDKSSRSCEGMLA